MFVQPANTMEQLASSLVLLAYISWLRGQAVQLLTFQWVDMNVLFSQDSGLHIIFFIVSGHPELVHHQHDLALFEKQRCWLHHSNTDVEQHRRFRPTLAHMRAYL